MFKLKKAYFKNIDYLMLFLMFLLVGIGTLAISSATSYSGSSDIVKKQIMLFIVGLILMFIVMCIDYHFIGDMYIVVYLATLFMLILIFFVGADKKGAARWIEIGSLQIQPSEFAKISMIVCTAKLIEKKNDQINQFWVLVGIGLFQFVPFLLINRQPNLSTSLVIVCLLVIQLFASELKLKYILVGGLSSLLIISLVLGYIIANPNQKIITDYQRGRIVTKIEGGDVLDDQFQTNRSMHAIGSGGLHGKGLYQGAISQLNYLPESHNDFIVATIAEEFGFVGMVTLIGLILLFILRGLWIAYRARDDLGKLIVVGYIGMIAMQSFVNMGVVTNLLPNTGLPLPFISYGGSALWANMLGLGLVLNVGMRRENNMF
jgi:rod shape determining protein RodA